MSNLDKKALEVIKEIVNDETYAQLLFTLSEEERTQLLKEIYLFHKMISKIEKKDA